MEQCRIYCISRLVLILVIVLLWLNYIGVVEAGTGGSGGGGGGGCFVAETLIKTPEGQMKIADVTAGDTVRGFDESGNIVENKILNVFSVQRDYYYLLTTEDYEVKVTAEHPFYTCEKKYKTAERLQLGDCVYVLRDGELVESGVVAKKRVNEPITVYNLQVSGTNTFFANNFAVHNKGEQAPGNPPPGQSSPPSSPPSSPGTGTTTTTTTAAITTTTTTTSAEKSLHIEILEKPTQLLVRGDTVSFKIKLTDENGAGAKGAKVLVWNKFFSQQLFETGIDGVYSAELEIPSNQTSGEDEIFFGAKRDQIEATTSIKLTFNTSLKISVATDNSSYVQGSNIKISGTVRNVRGEIVNITKGTVCFKSTVEASGSKAGTLVCLQYSLLYCQQYCARHGQPY